MGGLGLEGRSKRAKMRKISTKWKISMGLLKALIFVVRWAFMMER